MSDDLISRKRLKEAIHTDFAEHFTLYHDSDQTALIDMVMDDIDEAQTVFDKEKVIEKLKRLEKDTFDYYNRYNDEMAFGESAAFRSAIGIVEKGGIG